MPMISRCQLRRSRATEAKLCVVLACNGSPRSEVGTTCGARVLDIFSVEASNLNRLKGNQPIQPRRLNKFRPSQRNMGAGRVVPPNETKVSTHNVPAQKKSSAPTTLPTHHGLSYIRVAQCRWCTSSPARHGLGWGRLTAWIMSPGPPPLPKTLTSIGGCRWRWWLHLTLAT